MLSGTKQPLFLVCQRCDAQYRDDLEREFDMNPLLRNRVPELLLGLSDPVPHGVGMKVEFLAGGCRIRPALQINPQRVTKSLGRLIGVGEVAKLWKLHIETKGQQAAAPAPAPAG